MYQSQNYHKSSSKIIKVICRVESCKKEMTRQSYREHLRDVHPKENFKDQRVYGEQSMATFLSSMPRAKRPRQRAPGDISAIGPGSVQDDGGSEGGGIDNVLSDREMDENHSNSARGLTDQERLDREMWVAINSPDIAHCEGIVKEAVVEVDVSFIRRDSNIKSYDVSKAVDTVVNKPAKVPFLL